MKRLIVTILASACGAVSAWAMPTKAELTKAQPLIAELMAPTVSAFKSANSNDKAPAAKKVADASMSFASEAETEAAKFLLLKGAVNFYVRGEEYDKAADAFAQLQSVVKDVPSTVLFEIVGRVTNKISESKAPRLYAAYRAAKLQVKAENEVKALAVKLRKEKSAALQRRYAETLAVSSGWQKAYPEFMKLDNAKLKAVVNAEMSGKVDNAASAEFWWAYEPDFEDAASFFKARAVFFYRQALAANEIKGLKRNIAEQRLNQVSEMDLEQYAVDMRTESGADLTKRLTVSLPKADPIVFIPCPAGTFMMGRKGNNDGPFPLHEVTITRPFWMSEAPITIGQYCALMEPFEEYRRKLVDCYKNAKIDEVNLSELFFKAMGGDSAAMSGNTRQEISDYSAKLGERLSKTLPNGYIVRLPTEAEWEYALCCGGRVKEPNYAAVASGAFAKADLDAISVSPLAIAQQRADEKRINKKFGMSDLLKVPRYRVKTCRPNDWGFYDMIGLCDEVLVDTMGPFYKKTSRSGDLHRLFVQYYSKFSEETKRDPVMVYAGDDARSIIIGVFFNTKNGVPRWSKMSHGDSRLLSVGFRLVIGPDLVSEWKAKHGVK